MMAAPDLVNLSALLDDAKCFALVRQHRWPDGVCCPACGDRAVVRDGCDDTQPHRQRIGAKPVRAASTISPARCWPVIISRYESGYCASTSWG
jgi:transposase-like zinc ribbon protein